MATTVGTIELIAKIDTSAYKKGVGEINRANESLERSVNEVDKKSSRATVVMGKLAKAGFAAIAAAGVAAGVAIAKNMDNAIKRVDTLNNSARTFANMGFKAKDVDQAMKALDQSIRGLPTSLDSAVRGVQLLAGSTNDVGRAQKIFSALNNAIIGFGGNAEQVEGAIIQVSQAFSNGKVDAQTWNSLIQNGLGPALNALARQMGITTGELKAGLSEGDISVKKFQDSLIEMNTKGGGGMKSFAQIAKDATSGISTGWQNMNTAITRGIASIIQAIGSERISGAISKFGSGFEGMLKGVANLIPRISALATTVGTYLAPKLRALWNTISLQLIPALTRFWKNVVQPLIPVIGTSLVFALGLAVDALNVAISVISRITGFLARNKDMVYAVIIAVVAFKAVLFIGRAAAAFRAAVASMTAILNIYRTQGLARAMASTKLFRGLVMTPMVMPAIAVGAAIASLYAVIQAARAVMDAIRAVNDAARASDIHTRAQDDALRQMRYLEKHGTPQQKRNVRRQMKNFQLQGGFAKGTNFAPGGLSLVGELGPELVNLPRGSKVIPNDELGGLGGINITLNLSGVMARSRADLRDIGKDIINSIDEELKSKGYAPIMPRTTG